MQVNDALKEELLPSLRLDIPDLVHTVFGRLPQPRELAKKVFQKYQNGCAPLYTMDKGWAKWPPNAREHLVLDWLQDHTMCFTAWTTECGERVVAARRQFYRGSGYYIPGGISRQTEEDGCRYYGPPWTEQG